jgi:hypothetical protein
VKKHWMWGENFSVDGTLIQARAGHKSFTRKDGDDDAGGTGSFKDREAQQRDARVQTDPDSCAWHQEGRPLVRADDGGLQPHADAYRPTAA